MKQILISLTIRAMFCASASLSAENNYLALTPPESDKSYVFSPFGASETLKNLQLIISSPEKESQETLKQNRTKSSSAIDCTSYAILDNAISIKEPILEQLRHIRNIVLTTKFSNPSEASNLVNQINQIVVDKTQGFISKIIQITDIPPNTEIVLLNTVMVKNAWKYPLKKKAEALSFKFSAETTSNVQASYGIVNCQIYESEQSCFLGLETREQGLSMIFKLNKKGYTTNPLTGAELLAYQHNKIPQQVMLTLPNGYVTSTYNLLTTLLATPFLSKLSSTGLAINIIKQVAALEWDNLGLTGGASIAEEEEVMLMGIQPLKEITIDRPFSFACVQETSANSEIIFMGSIQDMDGLIEHYISKRNFGLKRNLVSSDGEKH